jgi:hypothetical protein
LAFARAQHFERVGVRLFQTYAHRPQHPVRNRRPRPRHWLRRHRRHALAGA